MPANPESKPSAPSTADFSGDWSDLAGIGMRDPIPCPPVVETGRDTFPGFANYCPQCCWLGFNSVCPNRCACGLIHLRASASATAEQAPGLSDRVDTLLDALSDGLTLNDDGMYLGEDAGILIKEFVLSELARRLGVKP